MTADEIKKAQELSKSISALGKSSNPAPQKKETYVIPSPRPEIKQDTPKEIADKLNTLREAVDSSVIKGLLKPSDVVEEIKNLKGNDRIDISHIRNGEQIARYFNKANEGFNMNDQRWHGAGSSGGGTPGGSNTQVQFNDSGSFGGSANFTWDNTNSAIGLFGSYIIGDGTDVYISGTPTPFAGAHPYIQFDANENFVDEAQIFGSDSAGNFFDITANNGNPSVEVYSIVNGKHVFLSPFRDSTIDTAGTFSLKTGASTNAAFLSTTSLTTSDKTFTFPDASGTIALTSNIGGAVYSGARGIGAFANSASTIYFDTCGYGPTETDSGNIVPYAGTLKNLYMDVFINTLNAGTAVYTLMKNGSATSITVTVNAGVTSITGDTTHAVSVSSGDRITIRCVTGGASGSVQFGFSYVLV